MCKRATGLHLLFTAGPACLSYVAAYGINNSQDELSEFDVRSVSDLNKLEVPYIDVGVPAYDMDPGSSCKQLGREPRTESNGLHVV